MVGCLTIGSINASSFKKHRQEFVYKTNLMNNHIQAKFAGVRKAHVLIENPHVRPLVIEPCSRTLHYYTVTQYRALSSSSSSGSLVETGGNVRGR